MVIQNHGAFGRKARFLHGPLPVVRTAHPATHDYVQLPSVAHKHCMLQYLFTPGVQSVLADRQLPQWVRSYVHPRTAHTVLLVIVAGGSSILVRLRSAQEPSAPCRIEKFHDYLWLVEQSQDDIEAQDVLNANLDELAQSLNSYAEDSLTKASRVVTRCLRTSARTTLAELTSHAHDLDGIRIEHIKVAVARMLLAGSIGVDVALRVVADRKLSH